ncbi:MAG: hypothetical protein GX921_01955, partial [Bacteroidales bacterium]|nr:hypothetical protein [Bacteroidales bacterium]
MSKEEKKLSAYIDKLNVEKKPSKNEYKNNDKELVELFDTVRLVRSLKEPTMPEEGYCKKLAKNISNRLSDKKSPRIKRCSWRAGLAALAVVMVLAFLFNLLIPLGNISIVSA